jgi:hypothetical protein
MPTTRQRIGMLLTLLAFVLVAGWALRGLGSAVASVAAQPASKRQYVDILIANFAARLGVDEALLNSAFTAVVRDTVDEAARNGTLSKEQAADVRKAAQDGLRGFLSVIAPGDGKGGVTSMPVSIEAAAASALGITEDQFKQELAAAKSFSELAPAHNMDPQQFQTALLNNCRAQLDAAMQRGTLTQTQADELYRDLARKLTAILTEKPDAAPPKE